MSHSSVLAGLVLPSLAVSDTAAVFSRLQQQTTRAPGCEGGFINNVSNIIDDFDMDSIIVKLRQGSGKDRQGSLKSH